MSIELDIENWRFTDFIQYYMKNPYPDFDYSTYVDKHKVKEFVKPVINVAKEYYYFTKLEQIDNFNFDSLPDSFIIKATHGCSWYVKVVDDFKDDNLIINFDKYDAVNKMKKWLSRKYSEDNEMQYDQLIPGVIIEEYLGLNCWQVDSNLNSYPIKKVQKELKEYKLWYIWGELIGIAALDPINHTQQCFYDENWKELPFSRKNNVDHKKRFEKPDVLCELVKIGSRLVNLIDNPPFVRIDIYDVCNKLYFGEYTFTPSGGLNEFVPDEYEKKFGEMIRSKING